jgi:hypothetical protein
MDIYAYEPCILLCSEPVLLSSIQVMNQSLQTLQELLDLQTPVQRRKCGLDHTKTNNDHLRYINILIGHLSPSLLPWLVRGLGTG